MQKHEYRPVRARCCRVLPLLRQEELKLEATVAQLRQSAASRLGVLERWSREGEQGAEQHQEEQEQQRAGAVARRGVEERRRRDGGTSWRGTF